MNGSFEDPDTDSTTTILACFLRIIRVHVWVDQQWSLEPKDLIDMVGPIQESTYIIKQITTSFGKWSKNTYLYIVVIEGI